MRYGLLLIAAAFCLAQPAFEVRGLVSDSTTGQPIQDVNVSIYPNGLLDSRNEIKLTTDSAGGFRYVPPKAGMFSLLVRKAGYTASSSASRLGGSAAVATLTDEKPSALVRLELQRPGEITGVIIDEETRLPLANLRVEVAPYRSTNGRPLARSGTAVTTAADGTFRAQNLPAGEYLIATVPQVSGPAHILTKFSEDDINATDLDYAREYFPGGPTIETALPFVLPSGGSINIGNVRVKKQPLNHVLINVDTSSCRSGVEYRAVETHGDRLLIATVPNIACGPILLTHVTAGTYEFSMAGADLGVARYTVTGSNLDVSLRLGSGTLVKGTLAADRDAGDLPLDTFKVRLGPVGLGMPPINVDSKGRFQVPNTRGGRQQVAVDGLGTAFFVQHVRYANQPAPGGLFDYAGSGEVEIVIGRSPASFSATVMAGDKVVPGADVVFQRWPPEPVDDPTAIRHLAADADGKVQLTGLGPGEYRVFAVITTDRNKAEQPAAWQRLTARAEKVTLEKGTSKSLVLAVSDPAR